jgi:hypothetical protein
MVAHPLNGVQRSSSSPTIQSHRLSLLTIPAIDLHTSLLSVSMDDDSLRTEARSAQDHSPVDSSFYNLQQPEQQANHVKPEDIMSRLFSRSISNSSLEITSSFTGSPRSSIATAHT